MPNNQQIDNQRNNEQAQCPFMDNLIKNGQVRFLSIKVTFAQTFVYGHLFIS